MKFEKHYSLVHAEKVLKLLRKKVQAAKGHKDSYVALDNWSNGREQGFHVAYYEHGVTGARGAVFAQARSSDAVVVLMGDEKHFDITTNMPSDALWKTRRSMDSDSLAADVIAQWLLEGVK